MSSINKTPILNLPQYQGTDTFDLLEINEAYKKIDYAYDVANKVPQTNATAEVIDARGGLPTLGEKVRKLSSDLEHKAKKTTLYVDDYYINENTTDTQAFQLCCNDAKSGEHTIINLNGSKKYLIDDIIYMKKDTSIEGNGATITIDKSMGDKWLFKINLNVDDSVTDLNPLFTAYIRNLYVLAPTDDATKIFKCFYFCQQIKFSQITFKGVDQCIRATNDYIDRMIVEDIYISNRRNTGNYAIHSGKQGDMRVFKRIQQGGMFDKEPPFNTLYVGTAHINVEVTNFVGAIGIDCYSNAMFKNIMLSHSGHISIYGANCKFNGIYGTINTYGKRINIYSYKLSDSSVQTKKSTFIMENSFFSFIDDFSETYANENISPIYIDDVDKFTLNNCFVGNRYGVTNILNAQSYTKVNYNSNNLNLDFYNKHTKALNGISYSPNDNAVFSEKIPSIAIGISTIVDGGEWKEKTGNYYYKICCIADLERRIGNDWSVEKSAECVKNGNGKILKVNITNDVNNILIFRGTETGVYNNYAIVSPNTNILLDNGYFVNGVKWEILTNSSSYSFLPKFYNIKYVGDNIVTNTGYSVDALKSHVEEYKNNDVFIGETAISKKVNGVLKSIVFTE